MARMQVCLFLKGFFRPMNSDLVGGGLVRSSRGGGGGNYAMDPDNICGPHISA